MLNTWRTVFDYARRSRILGYTQLFFSVILVGVIMHLAELGLMTKVSPLFYTCVLGLSITTALFNILFPGYLRATDLHNFRFAWMVIDHRKGRKQFLYARGLCILAAVLLCLYGPIEHGLSAIGMLSLNRLIVFLYCHVLGACSLSVCIFLLTKEVIRYHELQTGKLTSHRRYYTIWYNKLKMIGFDPQELEDYS